MAQATRVVMAQHRLDEEQARQFVEDAAIWAQQDEVTVALEIIRPYAEVRARTSTNGDHVDIV